MSIKVLILEDKPGDYETIVNPIHEHLGEHVDVFPKLGDEKVIEQFDCFLEEFVQCSKFEEITNHFKEIDVFILDVNLLDDTDNLGTRFYQHLKDVKYRDGEYKVIEVSSGPSEINKSDASFVSKAYDPFYFNTIVELIAKFFHLKIVNGSSKGKLSFGGFNQITKGIEHLDKAIRWIIHGLITISFYALILCSVAFSTYKIGGGFYGLVKVEQKDHVKIIEDVSVNPHDVQKDAGTSHYGNSVTKDTMTNKKIAEQQINAENKHGMESFLPAENIFLYLLPVFILFGFFNYYKTNTSIYLLNGNKERINEEASTRSMNLTKMIFISTIISYLVIKIIEQIFYSEQHLDFLPKMGAAAVILMLSMFFFLLMYRKH